MPLSAAKIVKGRRDAWSILVGVEREIERTSSAGESVLDGMVVVTPGVSTGGRVGVEISGSERVVVEARRVGGCSRSSSRTSSLF